MYPLAVLSPLWPRLFYTTSSATAGMWGAKAVVKPHGAKHKEKCERRGYAPWLLFLKKVLYRELIRFHFRSDVRPSPKYGRSAIDAERPMLIPSNYYRKTKSVLETPRHVIRAMQISRKLSANFNSHAKRIFTDTFPLLMRSSGYILCSRNHCTSSPFYIARRWNFMHFPGMGSYLPQFKKGILAG